MRVLVGSSDVRGGKPSTHPPGSSATAVTTGNYVIVLRRSTTIETLHHLLLKASKHSDDSKIHRYTETVAKAFTLKLSPYSVEVVSQIITCWLGVSM